VIYAELRDAESEGGALLRLGQVAQQRGDLQAAEDYYQDSLFSYRVAQYPHREGEVLTAIGELAQQRGQPDEAAGYFEEAQAIFKETTAADYVRVARKLDVWPQPRRLRL
jgi:tetratricopeptide (TPR) repeat protein